MKETGCPTGGPLATIPLDASRIPAIHRAGQMQASPSPEAASKSASIHSTDSATSSTVFTFADVEWICSGGMAKLADALDLKSNGPKGPCGFDSHSRYHPDFFRDEAGLNSNFKT